MVVLTSICAAFFGENTICGATMMVVAVKSYKTSLRGVRLRKAVRTVLVAAAAENL